MVIEPEVGLVIRYDYLWKNEQEAGLESGLKDRPCAVVLVSKARSDESRMIVVCPITHSPASNPRHSVEIPPKVAQHLGLDDVRSWVRTNTVNTFTWEAGLVPIGVSPATTERWGFGMLPRALGERVFNQIRDNSRAGPIETVARS